MKKLIVLAILIFISCNNLNYELDDSRCNSLLIKSQNFSYSLNKEYNLNTVTEILDFVSNNIIYTPDNIEYWQIPEETLFRNTGDSEDISIMIMYFLNKINIDSFVVITPSYSDEMHSIVEFNSLYWDPIIMNYTEKNYEIADRIPYNFAITMAFKDHYWTCDYQNFINN